MKIKISKFLILAIVAGVVLPGFENLGRASENEKCCEEFVDDPLFRFLDITIKGIFEAIENVRPVVSLSNIIKHECITYSLTQKAVDGISSALDVINKKNCSEVDEIEKLAEEVVSAAVGSTRNIYVTIRNLSEPYAEFEKKIDEIKNNAVNHISTAFRSLFDETKIVLAEFCPGNQLVKVDNNALELLKADNDEAVYRSIIFIDEMINLCADIHASHMKLHQSDAKDDSSLFQANRIKARTALADFFQYSYEFLKNFLLKSQKEA